MTVYVLLREDQNDHGFIDTSIAGVFRDAHAADEQLTAERLQARAQSVDSPRFAGVVEGP